jgi:hypothetical protein
MSPCAWRTVLFVPLILCCGCLGRQVRRDGDSLREAVADLYTNQALDNLIRARCNLPFVQLKFSTLNVTDTDEYSINGSVSDAVESDRDLFLIAAMRKVTNTNLLGGMGDRKRVMTFNGDPVTDQNDVYEQYLAFANNPSLLIVSDEPPRCPVHLQKKCGHKHYWIPCEAGPAFLDLVLKTSLMRGPETVPPVPGAYEVKILDVENVSKIVEGERDIGNGTVVFDKPVPNGQGTLVVDLADGRRIKVPLIDVKNDKDADGKPKRVRVSEPTYRLDIQWAPKRDGFEADQLRGRPARVYSRDYPPEAPAPVPAVIRRISTDVNQIKINQFSGSR